MQNAASALKMAFAILVFIIALSITFSCITQAKGASDFILYHIDQTNFYENLESEDLETTNGGRIVYIDTIISNLHRILQESFEVKVIIGNREFQFGLNNMTANELEERINEFKAQYTNDSSKYIETFSEIIYSGEYISTEDGTTVTVIPGLKKIYITYTKI